MSKQENQKLKLLYILQILKEKTDDEHGITVADLIDELAQYDVTAERKSIYSDLKALESFGVDIISEKVGRNVYYHIAGREFELAELKLLVDSVQAAKFITERKSDRLIRKIESLASVYEAQQLQRQVFVADRIKTMNESIYYNVDKLHQAIGSDAKVSFKYVQWNEKKQLIPRHDGKLYIVSPWALSWDSDNYYLIAYDSEDESIRHYRVDKMLDIKELKERREGKRIFRQFDMAKYAMKTFGMFGGEDYRVRLRCKNSYAGIIIDRFGRDVMLVPDGEEHFTVNVDVMLSPQFIAWVIGLGDGVKIVSPDEVVDAMRSEIKRLSKQYEEV